MCCASNVNVHSRFRGNDDLRDTGIQYNMPAIADSLRRYSREIRLIIGFLDSRYEEKYSRWRSLFFYRSGMTIWGTMKNMVAGAPYFSIVRE